MNIELKEAIITLAKAYKKAHNEAVDNLCRETQGAETAVKAKLDEVVKAYNDDVRKIAYTAATKAADPFMFALEEETFCGLCKVKTKLETLPDKTKGLKFDDVELKFDVEEYYNLKTLDDMNETGTWAHEQGWAQTLLSLRLPFAAARAQATALDLAKFRKAFGLAADCSGVNIHYTPENATNGAKAFAKCVSIAHADSAVISRNNLRELLQYAVNAIMFKRYENTNLNTYRVAKSDVTWFMSAMANYQNHATAFCRPDTMYHIMFDLLGHIIYNRDYNVACGK